MTISRVEFDQFVKEQSSLLSPNTMEGYRASIDNFIRFLCTKKVTPKIVDDWSNKQLEDGVTRVTVGKYRCGVRAFFDWKIRGGTWDKPNPVYAWKNLRCSSPPRQAFTEEEYRTLLASAPVAGTYWKPLIVIAWHTGLRMGDIATLEWKDVDMNRYFIRVVPAKTKKFGKAVEIPFGKEVFDCLSKQAAARDMKYVIRDAANDYLTDRHKTISTTFGRILKKVIMSGKSFHSFRHAFVTRHLDAGTNPAVIAAITGHSLSNLMNYAHTSLDTKRAAMKI